MKETLVDLIRSMNPNPQRARDLAHHLRTTDIPQRDDGNLGRPGQCMCVLGASFVFVAPTLEQFEELIRPRGWGDAWGWALKEVLDAEDHVDTAPIYDANDSFGLTFADFADILEEAVREP